MEGGGGGGMSTFIISLSVAAFANLVQSCYDCNFIWDFLTPHRTPQSSLGT